MGKKAEFKYRNNLEKTSFYGKYGEEYVQRVTEEYKSIGNLKGHKGKNIGLAGMSLNALRKMNVPVSLGEVAGEFSVQRKYVLRFQKRFCKEPAHFQGHSDVLKNYIGVIVEELKLPEAVKGNALKKYEEKKDEINTGKNPTGIAIACVYETCKEYETKNNCKFGITQEFISEKYGISQVTLIENLHILRGDR